jgi:hypothetical protein
MDVEDFQECFSCIVAKRCIQDAVQRIVHELTYVAKGMSDALGTVEVFWLLTGIHLDRGFLQAARRAG